MVSNVVLDLKIQRNVKWNQQKYEQVPFEVRMKKVCEDIGL